MTESITAISSVNDNYNQSYSSFDKTAALSSPQTLLPFSSDTISSASTPIALPAEEQKSLWKKTTDWLGWLGSFIGISNQPSPAIEATSGAKEVAIQSVKGSIPKLEAPKEVNQSQRTKIMQLKQEIEKQEEEIYAFEEEMRQANSSYLDTRILQEQIACGMIQKKEREGSNAERQEDSIEEQRIHKELQTSYYDLKKAIAQQESREPILRWVGYATTGATLGIFAASIVTAGAALGLASRVLALSRASLTAFKWVLKNANDKNMGELFVVRHQMDECTTGIKMNLSDMRTFNAEISKLLKSIKENLDNNYQSIKTVIRP